MVCAEQVQTDAATGCPDKHASKQHVMQLEAEHGCVSALVHLSRAHVYTVRLSSSLRTEGPGKEPPAQFNLQPVGAAELHAAAHDSTDAEDPVSSRSVALLSQ